MLLLAPAAATRDGKSAGGLAQARDSEVVAFMDPSTSAWARSWLVGPARVWDRGSSEEALRRLLRLARNPAAARRHPAEIRLPQLPPGGWVRSESISGDIRFFDGSLGDIHTTRLVRWGPQVCWMATATRYHRRHDSGREPPSLKITEGYLNGCSPNRHVEFSKAIPGLRSRCASLRPRAKFWPCFESDIRTALSKLKSTYSFMWKVLGRNLLRRSSP